MYRSIVAVYSSLAEAAALRRELEDAGVPPSQVHISTEEAEVPATALPAHEPRGFSDWLFGVPENDLSFFRESLEAGRTIVKVHVAADMAETVTRTLDRYSPITVDSATERTVPVRSYGVELPFEDLVRQREEDARVRRREPATAGADSRARR
jgi:hypothetical protein